MRVHVMTAAVLTSLLLWAGSYYVLRETYQTGQAIGVMPNLHIKDRFGFND